MTRVSIFLVPLVAVASFPAGAEEPSAVAATPAPSAGDAVAPVKEAVAPVPAATATPERRAETLPPTKGPKKRSVRIGGYAKVGFLFQQSDQRVDYIGHSNGFRMAGARVEVIAKPMANAEAVISVDGALDRPTDPTGVSGEKMVSLRDAYLEYEFAPQAVLSLGQFKAPFMAEALLPDADLVFLDRSIVSRGALPPEGYAASGLSIDRQIGLSVSSRRLAFGDVGVSYALGLFNGNGENRIVNDNRSLTPAGRLSVDFAEKAALGLAGYRNPRTRGVRPDLLEEVDTGLTADVTVTVMGAKLLAAYSQRKREFMTVVPAVPSDTATGILVQASYRHDATGLEGAYRLSIFDPSALGVVEKVTHHTVGVGYHPSDRPVRLFLSYTLRRESPERVLANDGLDLGAQLTF